MLLWIGFALLTVFVIAALAYRALRDGAGAPAGEAADVAVYRDQLKAIETEREQGLLEAGEAEAARAELARRLLRAADAPGALPAERSGKSRATASAPAAQPARWAIASAAILIPIAAFAIYFRVGSPSMPGKPHAERVAQVGKGQHSMQDLLGMVEARLRDKPEDGQGWDVIAPIYLKQERFKDASHAYANAIRLLGETPQRISGFAAALVMGNNGIVSRDAHAAFERLLAIQPGNPEARFWLAMAKEQGGDVAGAIADMEALAKAAPPDASWRQFVETRIAEMRKNEAGGGKGAASTGGAQPAAAGASPKMAAAEPKAAAPADQSAAAAAPPPGPTAADIAAAQALSPQEQEAFIAQMVDRLAARLDKNGNDLEGWKRLIRAYRTMGRDQDAQGAIAKARRAMEGNAAALQDLTALAQQLGIGS